MRSFGHAAAVIYDDDANKYIKAGYSTDVIMRLIEAACRQEGSDFATADAKILGSGPLGDAAQKAEEQRRV